MIRVLLVDDQALVRSGFRIILESEPGIAVVGEASNGAEAVALAAELAPQVICMDVEMPEMNGLEAARRIRAAGAPRPSVLMITTFNREDYVLEALRAGASGFLLKTARAEQLIDAVRTLAAGDALLSPDVTRTVLNRLARTSGDPEFGVPGSPGEPRMPEDQHQPRGAQEGIGDLGITQRELEVLQLVAAGHSNAEIAERLFLGEATVKTHVSKVLTKLGVRDRTQAVVWAFNSGLVRPDPREA